MTTPGVCIVTTAVSGWDAAAGLAREIVERRLAACVHIHEVTSVFRWEGKLNSETEHVLRCKTAVLRAGDLMQYIRDRHDYELPEITVTPVHDGLAPFLDWVVQETCP